MITSEEIPNEKELRSYSINVIEQIVKKVETVFEENNNMNDLVEESQNVLTSHVNFMKKTTVKIDSLVNNIKSTNNRIFETISQMKAPIGASK